MYDYDEDITKKCGKCKEDLPLYLFYDHKNGKHGKSWVCIQCEREMRNSFGANVSKRRAQELARDAKKRQKYDIDVLEIMEGNDEQGMTEQDAYNLLDEVVK